MRLGFSKWRSAHLRDCVDSAVNERVKEGLTLLAIEVGDEALPECSTSPE